VRVIGGAFEPRLLKRKDAAGEPRAAPTAEVPDWAVALGAAALVLVGSMDRLDRYRIGMTAGACALAAIPWVMLLMAAVR
jgi:hypothetical protein